MKTIFVTCSRGIISRNIFATDAFRLLADANDARIVIIAPRGRTSMLRQEFARPNVIVEDIDVSVKEIEKPVEKFFWIIATNLLRTKTRSVQRNAKYAEDRNFADYFFSIAVSFFGRFRLIRNFYRFAAGRCVGGKEFDYLFERYRPDLVFATDVYAPHDVKFMRAAERRGIKNVGMVRSWDNVTSKTLLSFLPDRMVVNSEHIRDEIVHYGDMPRERVFVVGVPHYDRYRKEYALPRKDFLAKYGIGGNEKFILLAAPSDVYLTANPVTPVAMRALGRVNANVLVRLPLVGKAEIDEEILRDKPANAFFDDPGMYPDFTNAYLSAEMDRHLVDCLNAADVVITWASTMIIDAAVFNKPIILIGFDASPRPYHQSLTRYYDYDHHRFILGSGGVRLAHTPDELRSLTEQYLANPTRDEEGRNKIVREYCGPLDGKSGERLGHFLLGELGMA